MKKISVFLVLIVFLLVMVSCGGYTYKPLTNNLVNAKVAIVYDFDWRTDAKGLFGGWLAGAGISLKVKKVMEQNLNSIKSNYASLLKENLAKLNPNVVIDENAIFNGSNYNDGDYNVRFKQLADQGITHVLLFKYVPKFIYNTSGKSLMVLKFDATIVNIKTNGELAAMNVNPEVICADKNNDAWKYEDIIAEKSNSANYLIKVTLAGLKFFIPKAMEFIKSGSAPQIAEEYNGESFLAQI